jgi:hypothetical protein
VEDGTFDQAIVSHSDGRRETMTRDEYYRLPLKVRVDQLVKGQVRFFYQGQPVSPLKATRRG